MARKLMSLLLILMITSGIYGCKIDNKDSNINEENRNKQEDNINHGKEINKEDKAGEIKIASKPENNPEAAKVRKDTMIVGIGVPNWRFNPIYSNSIYDNWICNLIFEGLISHDAKGNPIGRIAKSWSISEDGKTYNFRLKDNVRFSDGTMLTSEDVKFTYTALCDPDYTGIYGDSFKLLVGYKEYNEGNATEVSGIRIINDNEISFTFNEIKASLIHEFSIGILSKKYYEYKKGNIKTLYKKLLDPMGTGPYSLNTLKTGEEITFKKNENYWMGSVNINNIIMKLNIENSGLDEVINGNLDIVRIAATPQNVSVLKEAGFLNLHIYDDNAFQYIGLNLRKDKFRDRRVRQALVYGLNRKSFVEDYYGEYGSILNSPFPKASWVPYNSELNKYDFDKEKSNKLLEESGWILKEDGFRYDNSGKRLTIKWSTYEGSSYVEKLIKRVKEDWKGIGIEVIEEILPFKTFVERVFENQDFEMYNMAWNLGIDPDPSYIFALSEDIPGGYNAVGWRNPDGENLIQAALLELNIEKRKEVYKQWAKLANEELPYIYLNENKELYAVNCRIKNLELSPYTDWTENIHKLFLENK